MDFGIKVVLLIVALIALSLIRLVPENERYARLILGRFTGFKGPGLVLKLRGSGTEWKRVRLGERGTVLSSDVGRFPGGDLPIVVDGYPKVGAFVRVTGFQEKHIMVAVDPDQSRVVVCSKCGHQNVIT